MVISLEIKSCNGSNRSMEWTEYSCFRDISIEYRYELL